MIELPRWARRVLGFDATLGPPHVFAVGPQEIRYGRFEGAAGEGLALHEHRRVALDPGTFEPGVLGGPLRAPEAFAEAVERLLGGVSAPVEQASLVLPDEWLRLSFVELGELPASHESRLEILRWKLKRLVPFRVEDLRLDFVPVAPLPGQREPNRLLVAFGLEALLAQLESAFAARQVWLGRIGNRGLGLLAALRRELAPCALAALVPVQADGYSLLFTRRGEPALYRHKTLDRGQGEGQLAATVERDLRLTRAFLGEHLPDLRLERVLLLAPPPLQTPWRDWLAAGLGQTAEAVSVRHLPLSGEANVAPEEVAPLLGVASQEVA
ncbi:MAG TPA: hypothetical protein VMT16_09385 [Thermoanaerobaculia bacterium]|nr:hypothetical protein [Thermoanaerobaculia bacterium]